MDIRLVHSLPQYHKIVSTHGELAPRNIHVQDARIVPIVDRELPGFNPDDWEYVKSILSADFNSFWVTERVADRFLPSHVQELAYFLHARDCI